MCEIIVTDAVSLPFFDSLCTSHTVLHSTRIFVFYWNSLTNIPTFVVHHVTFISVLLYRELASFF